MKAEQTVIDSDSGIPCKCFSLNPSLESCHNRFAALRAIDQSIRVFLEFLRGMENDGAVSFYVCIMFNVNFKIVYKYSYHDFMLSLQEMTQNMSVTPR